MAILFANRREAGARLAESLERFRSDKPVVLGMARGGVLVAAEVARILAAPLEPVVVRKIGAPHNMEFAVGAVGPGGIVVLDPISLASLKISNEELDAAIARERAAVERQSAAYGTDQSPTTILGRTVIIVDDGLATGLSALAAVRFAKGQLANKVVMAAPVGSPAGMEAVSKEADEVVCSHTPEDFFAVGTWYEDFRQVEDEEVTAALSPVAP